MPAFGAGFRSLFANRAAVHLVMGVTITSLIGYGQTAFGPSFIIRNMGMNKLEIASIVAPIGAVCGTMSERSRVPRPPRGAEDRHGAAADPKSCASADLRA